MTEEQLQVAIAFEKARQRIAKKAQPRNEIQAVNRLAGQFNTALDDVQEVVTNEVLRKGRIPRNVVDTAPLRNAILNRAEGMRGAVQEEALSAAQRGRRKVISDLQKARVPGLSFNDFPARITRNIMEHAFQASEGTMARMVGNVMGRVAGGVEQGLGIRDIADFISSEFEGMKNFELKRIARTEVQAFQLEGTFQTERELGVKYHQWVAADDDRTRSSHEDIMGEIVEVGEPFSNGLLHPLDRSGPLEKWINCHCRVRPFIIPHGKVAPGFSPFREGDLEERKPPKNKNPKRTFNFNKSDRLFFNPYEQASMKSLSELSVEQAIKQEVPKSAIIALSPSLADSIRLEVDGGAEIEELHVTLAYLGDANEPLVGQDVAMEILEDLAEGPVEAEVFASSVFNPTSSEPATVLLLQSDKLVELRERIVERIGDSSEFPSWVPHLTLGYDIGELSEQQMLDRLGTVTFDSLGTMFAGERQWIGLDNVASNSFKFFHIDQFSGKRDFERDERGRFAATGAGGGMAADAYGSPEEIEEARAMAEEKVAEAPVPSEEEVAKHRADMARAEGRAGGDSRGGSAKDRRNQRRNLYRDFGGEEKGYVVCHSTGLKMHWADPNYNGNAYDPLVENPNGYPSFERGKIYTKYQGGAYRLNNLLPESFEENRGRGDTPLRPENLD